MAQDRRHQEEPSVRYTSAERSNAPKNSCNQNVGPHRKIDKTKSSVFVQPSPAVPGRNWSATQRHYERSKPDHRPKRKSKGAPTNPESWSLNPLPGARIAPKNRARPEVFRLGKLAHVLRRFRNRRRRRWHIAFYSHLSNLPKRGREASPFAPRKSPRGALANNVCTIQAFTPINQ